jgi:phospholipid/cholesterol/gamma-HCH transport system substrate-binding protein
MASPKRVRWAQLRVGLLAVAAMTLAAVMIFLLTSNTAFFEGRFHLRTYMEDSAGMADSSPVRLNGILVGNIEKVRLSNDHNPKRTVEIDMSIREGYLSEIPEDSVAGISAANLLGDKYINITKGRSGRHVQPGGELKSQDVVDVPQLLAQSATILTSFQSIAGRVDGILSLVESGKGNIGKLIKDDELYNRVNATAAEVNQIVHDVRGKQGTISKLIYEDDLYQEIRRPIQKLDVLIGELQAGKGTAGKLLKDEALYSEARQSLTDARTMLDSLNAGKGTAGKLLKDDELYRQVNVIIEKLNNTIAQINQGQGTVGQLVVNRDLYDSLNGATKEAQALIKDMRANPKKFLRIKLALF